MIVLLVLLVAAVWGSLFIVYDYRSPVSQFLRGVGTVQLEGWSAYDLDTACIRLEEADGTPSTTSVAAAQVAAKAYRTGYVREVLLVSFHNTCTGSDPQLAWAVAVAWQVTPEIALATAAPPRAVVIVDARTGAVILQHLEGQPSS
jgi:hypothetical protein